MAAYSVDRRTLLLGALGAATLSACGTGGGTQNAPSNNAKVKMPTYTPFTQGPKPDLPGTPEGVLDGFLKYPANPIKVTAGPPGDGSAVSVFVQTYSPVAPGIGTNKYWQELNKALNADMKISVVPANDYSQKFAALVAGDELPDLMHVRTNVVDIPALMKAKFQDLTPFLSGDAVKEYPFLANIKEIFWKQCIHNGAIYGIPIPRAVQGGLMFRRDDLIAAKGLNPDPATYADFRKLCQDLTDQRANRWAITGPDVAVLFIMQMLGMPRGEGNSGWKLDGGKLTMTWELEQAKQAMADAAQLWKDGVIHPDSFPGPNADLTANYKQWFNAGSAALAGDNYPAWPQFYVQNVAGAGFKVGGMIPPNYDGSTKAVTWQGTPSFSFTAFKKAPEARIKQLLKICDWMAAPFGSAEYLLKNYGVEDIDWKRNADGDPVQTDTGKAEVPGLGVGYIAAPHFPLYYPGQSQATKDGHAYQLKAVPMSVGDPTLGMYSPTASRQSGALSTKLSDARYAIIRGEKPVSSWDDVMKDWRTSGGDQIRKELEQAIAQNA
ncbi:extracellular solute-binding protein [Allorhizocola rhizosphaerae]|uniref:extracellular solute-binding protein n=1 Tax=Allorhizocola rhizosphaerae TaxID=1872709 RepID=UPI000E3DD5B5|nr:extracellular solute-binding protein [Allorhizocola rhizosphaerae]